MVTVMRCSLPGDERIILIGVPKTTNTDLSSGEGPPGELMPFLRAKTVFRQLGGKE
jgi:hypothetical protein